MNPIVIFIIVFILEGISFFGYSKVASILSLFYCKFFKSELFNSIAKHKREIIHLKKKLNDISCQDEFAKWVKVNRKLTAATAEYEEESSKGNSAQSSATLIINLILKVLLVCVRISLYIFLRKETLFYAKYEWLGQFSYILTSKGAIHIFVWMLICSNISKRILNAIKSYKVEIK
ncbi:hypothetical protein LY90DRAFT_678328 [Neocallimastix californiae]|uniref:Guided entry of tail-anchored proteins factor 1 n=1 Tax=Neocallimastix californiae TaxID=1754190 RepID=A0A1Y1Z929_9FUNG|nr:hypothetical protein LY90DRAFT_678328 [Neocallimastix californiae]|eukprot:ORY06782.1 hypothetical protein LY90DRAFT_678328 [Neocallimastix californiae]